MTSTGHLARLSESALRLAVHLDDTEPRRVARWLYNYGRVPRTPAIDRDFGPGDEPMGVLGLGRGASVRRLLEERYVASADQGWYSFFPMPLDADFHAACKLYVSPRPEALAVAFPVIAKTFADTDVRSFKVGRGREGLLRSDKIVAYFVDHAHAMEVAATLVRTLTDCPVQGVPFTAELGGGGLVSWGADPEGGATGTSWRSWITTQLAASLTVSPVEAGDPVDRARAAMRAVAVDPASWAPVDTPTPVDAPAPVDTPTSVDTPTTGCG